MYDSRFSRVISAHIRSLYSRLEHRLAHTSILHADCLQVKISMFFFVKRIKVSLKKSELVYVFNVSRKFNL